MSHLVPIGRARHSGSSGSGVWLRVPRDAALLRWLRGASGASPAALLGSIANAADPESKVDNKVAVPGPCTATLADDLAALAAQARGADDEAGAAVLEALARQVPRPR